jgi:uncharacterized membrane protein
MSLRPSFVLLVLALAAGCGGSPAPSPPAETHARYLARGNEPGWTLELGPDRVVWTTDYGSTRHVVTHPTVDQAAGFVRYRGAIGADSVEFRVVDLPCEDDMSGEGFSRRIEIHHAGRTLRGCGDPVEEN